MEPSINRAVLLLGPVAVVAALVLALVTGTTATSTTAPPWAATLALVALAVGVPHGAVDHLLEIQGDDRRARLRYASGYLALALAALALILLAPAPSFIAVLAMSVWHFGSGDVEAQADLRAATSSTRPRRWVQVIALGAAPVLLPLTSGAAVASLSLVNPALVVLLTPAATTITRGLVLVAVAVALTDLVRHRDHRGAIELALLTALGLIVTPLVAFGVYFAFWHAARHTARLAQSEPGAAVTSGRLLAVIRAGLPALVVVCVVVPLAAVFLHGNVTLIGLGLAAVWGLTVPHMVAVGAFDRRRRTQREPVAAT
jgi:beta-carotene 15,15'-dioxygenase